MRVDRGGGFRAGLFIPGFFAVLLICAGVPALTGSPAPADAADGAEANAVFALETSADPDQAEASLLSVQPKPQDAPHFAVLPSRARPGEPITVACADDFSGPRSRDFQAVLIDRNGRRLLKAPFFSFTQIPGGHEVKAAILAIPSTAGSGSFLIRIEAGGKVIQDIPLTVDDREFVTEVIPLDERNTEIRTSSDPQKTAESQTLWAVLSRTGTDIFHGGPFTLPVSSTRRTSFFGDRRTFQYVDGSTDTAIHAGVDYGVPTGTDIRSCAPGRVVMARYRVVTGNSVVVEHLPGVYSLYYHLDSLSVEENVLVGMGALLGRSGSTGLATGPHLHWEIRVAGENADPDVFTARAILDKDEILRNLTR